MMAKFQRFGGAMFTPVVFFVFSGIIVGLTSVFTNPTIMGSIAGDGTAWTNFWSIIDAGGWTVFNNMEVLFVIGLPLGLANKAKERAALEAFVLYMTFNNFVNIILQHWGKGLGVNLASTAETSGLKVIAGVKTLDTGVIGAILIAGLVVWLHNRYFDVKLPDWLGVFQGSAFVAMIGFFAMIPVAALFCWIWPAFQHGVLQLQFFMVKSGRLGIFMYIFLEKALLPVGLHHFIYAPFQYGPAIVEGGTTLYWMKHITAFAASTKSMTTLFPEGGFAMQGLSNIFGVPGIALAFYATAKQKNRKKVLALIVPGVLTSVFAGITEPFDYTFLFIAPVLFYVHALLAATLATTMYSFGVTGDMQGGLIEMAAKNYIPMWANHWLTYVIQWGLGLAFIAIYFFIFRYLILKFNFPTPGRTDDEMVNMFTKKDYQAKKAGKSGKNSDSPFRVAAGEYIKLLGGAANISTVNNCFTRLRLTIKDPAQLATDAAFMGAGAKGVVRNGMPFKLS
jgi:PTS system arbutin-like IIC component